MLRTRQLNLFTYLLEFDMLVLEQAIRLQVRAQIWVESQMAWPHFSASVFIFLLWGSPCCFFARFKVYCCL